MFTRGARVAAALAVAAIAFAAGGAARAARVDSPGLPVDRLLTVQPIQVCQGGACAATTFLPQYITAANVILNQAGIGVAAAPLVRLDAPTVGAGQPNYLDLSTTGGLFDDIRRLVRENGRGATPQTLNVFLVNSITETTPTATRPLFGWGLVGGNGAVVATGVRRVEVSPGVFQNRTAAADTLAHEIAHNLGLPHPEDAPQAPTTSTLGPAASTASPLPWRGPRNLMQSSGRSVFADYCQIPPYTCATGTQSANARGALVQQQRDILRNPLLLTQLPRVDTTATLGGPPGVVDTATTTTRLSADVPARLTGAEFRFRHAASGTVTPEFVPLGGGASLPATVATTPAPDGPGLVNRVVRVSLGAGFGAAGTGFAGGWQVSGPLAAPHSSQYTFGNGFSSRAGFDASGGARSDLGAEFAFDPGAAGGGPVESLLPQDLFDAQGTPLLSPLTGLPVEAAVDPNFSLVEDLLRLPLPFAAFELPPDAPPYDPPPAPPLPPPLAAVPAPGALGVLAVGAAGLLALLGAASPGRGRRRGGRARSWAAAAGFAAAALAGGGGGAARAAIVGSPALPVERVVTIQPIQVCQPACADITFLAQYITAANVILNQARIGVAAAPVARLDAPAPGAGSPNFLNLSTNNTLFDDIRALVRDNGRAADSRTLNVFLVNSITDTRTNTPLYGWGLVGGNGSVVATGVRRVEVSPGVFQNRTAAVDTLAHELAHNLGLPHPEDQRLPQFDTDGRPLNDSRNLMRSVGRAALTNLCQVPPYTCATGTAAANQRAVLTTRQIGTSAPGSAGTLRNPLVLTQLPNVQTAGTATSGGNQTGSGLGSGSVGEAFLSTSFLAPSPAPIRSVEFRYRGVVASAGAVEFRADPAEPGFRAPLVPTTVTDPLGNANQVWRATVPAGQTFLPPSTLTTIFTVPSPDGFTTSSRPQSTQYEFANGITSRAGFDGTGGDGVLGTSAGGVAFSLDPLAGDGLPALLPRDVGLASPVLPGGGLAEALVETNFTTPEILAGLALPDGALDLLPTAPPGAFDPPPAPPVAPDFAPVPAPGALGLFALGGAALYAARRRRR